VFYYVCCIFAFIEKSIDLFLPIGAGAWQLAYDSHLQRQLKTVVCSKPQTFEDVRTRRIKAEKDGTSICEQQTTRSDDGKVLDGFFLVSTRTYFRYRVATFC